MSAKCLCRGQPTSMNLFTTFSKQVIPSSAIMPFDEAQDIVAKFGDNVIELAEFHRKQVAQMQGGQQRVLYSLPIEQLKHSKWQIQIALAVTVAEYVIRVKTDPSNQNRGVLNAASSSCQYLAWFTRKPAFFPVIETDSEGLRKWLDGDPFYWWWRELCERSLKANAGDLKSGSVWPTAPALIQYWDNFDYNISGLLNRSALIAIRQT